MFAASIQGEGVLAKSKSQSGLGTMQAWIPTGEPIHGRGSYVLDLTFQWPFRVGAGPTPCRTVSYTLYIYFSFYFLLLFFFFSPSETIRPGAMKEPESDPKRGYKANPNNWETEKNITLLFQRICMLLFICIIIIFHDFTSFILLVLFNFSSFCLVFFILFV